MVAAAGKSSATVKSSGSGSLVKSKKRKSERNLLENDGLVRRLSSAAVVTRSFLETNDLILPPYQSLRLESLLSYLPNAPSHCCSSSSTTWFERFVNSADEDDPRWCICFRMSKPTFFNLLSILTSTDSPSLAATIFRLAHNASYKSLLLRFGFASVADASRVFFTVCKLINEKLGLLGDPKPDYSPRLLPNCCGVLGFGSFHVHGKLLESLTVQAVVDSTGRFADISAGWPSTMKPEAIFRQTKLFSESRSFLNGPPCRLGNGISVHPYILGHSCLPLLPWLVTPYSSNEEEEDAGEFNNVVQSALGTVEIVFAKVRARWRILDRKWKPETVEFLPFVVTTACLLHNFLVDSGDNDDDLQEEWVDDGEMRKDEDHEEETKRSEEGEAFRRIRDAIAENLSRVSSSKMI